jgi:hypothetical protein
MPAKSVSSLSSCQSLLQPPETLYSQYFPNNLYRCSQISSLLFFRLEAEIIFLTKPTLFTHCQLSRFYLYQVLEIRLGVLFFINLSAIETQYRYARQLAIYL